MGEMSSKRGLSRIPRISRSPRIHIPTTDVRIPRGRRRASIEFGLDPLEARAIAPGLFPGSTLPERIVYKKLMEMIGEENFVFQWSEGGGRTGFNFVGGYLIDFVIIDHEPYIALEVLGNYWHRLSNRWADAERALEIISLGFQYEEVMESEIYQGDQYLEMLLSRIVRRIGINGPSN